MLSAQMLPITLRLSRGPIFSTHAGLQGEVVDHAVPHSLTVFFQYTQICLTFSRGTDSHSAISTRNLIRTLRASLFAFELVTLCYQLQVSLCILLLEINTNRWPCAL